MIHVRVPSELRTSESLEVVLERRLRLGFEPPAEPMVIDPLDLLARRYTSGCGKY